MPRQTGSTDQPSFGTTTSGLTHRTPTLASALTRGWRREIERRLEEARYHVGIDLGTTNSSVAIVDAQALLEGDTDAAVSVLPVRQECSDGTITSPLLASVVAEVAPGEWWVGRGAREARSRGLLRGRQVFYSTKSEMGLGREPFYPSAASREYDSPFKVAGRVLAELARAVENEVGPDPLARAVVTVPASFQLAARKDTFRAAAFAGLPLSEEALLDEPNAALLDYLLTCRPRTEDGRFFDLSHPRTVLVFDFGGGTCDVSVVRVHADRDEQQLHLANLSIARYEQLGGDNIDAAIVERVLLPQLLRQNGLATLDVSFSEKQERIVPQLLSAAEALKLGLRDVPRSLQVELPARAGVPLRTLALRHPSMTAADSRRGAGALPGRRLHLPRDTEMNRVSSIFVPVRDALRRARLDAGQVDAVLLVGGSALLPQVQEALSGFFPRAEVLRFPDDARTLSAVARGAALHSFFLHGIGRPLLRPITSESLGILTQEGGYVELVPRGAELPYPRRREGGAVEPPGGAARPDAERADRGGRRGARPGAGGGAPDGAGAALGGGADRRRGPARREQAADGRGDARRTTRARGARCGSRTRCARRTSAAPASGRSPRRRTSWPGPRPGAGTRRGSPTAWRGWRRCTSRRRSTSGRSTGRGSRWRSTGGRATTRCS